MLGILRLADTFQRFLLAFRTGFQIQHFERKLKEKTKSFKRQTQGLSLGAILPQKYFPKIFIRVYFVLRPVRSYILAIFWYFLGPNFFTHQSRQMFWPCHQNGLRTFADFVWRSSQIGEFCGSGTLGLSNKTLEKMWKRKVK